MSTFLRARGRHVRRTYLRRRVAGAALAAGSLLAGSMVASSPAQAASDPCNGSHAPVLRGVVITQGVGGETVLVRGKTTLVRLLLSAPSCAAAGSHQLLAASLRVADGSPTTVEVPTTPAVLGPAYPVLDAHANAPTNNSPGNPLFQIPALAAANTSTGELTVSFSASVTYQYLGQVQPPVRYSQSPTDPRQLITARVAPKTNALRVLVVPLANTAGSTGAPPAAQFPTSRSQLPVGVTQLPTEIVQTGMLALSRMLPVRDGVGDLDSTVSPGPLGLRYRLLAASSIDVGPDGLNMLNSNGKFCGHQGNFDRLSAQLASFLSTWNSKNNGAQADRVVGVSWQEASVGGGGCAEGMAALNGTQAWVRLHSDNAPSPGDELSASPYVGRGTSMTGPLLGMELAHSLGSVPSRDPRSQTTINGVTFYEPHSPNVSADGASPLQTYNTTLATWLGGALSVMRYSGTSGGTNASSVPSAWNNNTALYERDDYRFLHCALTPGIATSLCPYNTRVGTAGSAAASGRALMIGGVTDGTPAGTQLHTFEADGVELTPPDPAGAVRVVQRDAAGTIIAQQGVALVEKGDHHDGTTAEFGSAHRGTISAAVALLAETTAFELWLGPVAAGAGPCTPGRTPVGGCFYARAVGSQPAVTSSTGSSALTNVQNFTADSGDDIASALSPDAKTVAWVDGGRISIRHRNASTGRPEGAASPSFAGTDPSWSPDGSRLAYATPDGDIYVVPVRTSTTPPQVGTPTLVYNHLLQSSPTLGSTAAGDPSFDPTGQRLAVSLNGGVWRVTADERTLPANGVTCNLISFEATGTCDVLSRVGNDPSWNPAASGTGAGLVAFDAGGGIATVAPTAASSSNGFPAMPRVANAASPSWGGGLLGFSRSGAIWIADPSVATGPTWDNQTQVTSGGSDAAPSLAGGGKAVAFDRATGSSTGRDVFTAERTDHFGSVSFTATTQGDPALLEADLYQSCGSGLEPVTVFRLPDATDDGPPASATFSFPYDDRGGCAGGELLAQVTNGFRTSALTTVRRFPPPSFPGPVLQPVIGSPTSGSTYLQYDHVIGAASTIAAPTGTNPSGVTGRWLLTGPEGSGFDNTEVGQDPGRLYLDPPVGGWRPGAYTLVLDVGAARATTTYVVLPDPGHLGQNVGVTFSPQTLYVPSNGNYVSVTVRPQAQRLSAVMPSTVRITEIGKHLLRKPIGLDPAAGANGWAANPDGSYTAKFNRQVLSCALAAQDLVGFYVPIVVTGSGPGVAFTGFDNRFPNTTPATSPTSCS